MFYTYVLWNKEDKKFYIGYTADLKRRMQEHNCNGVHSTSRFKSAKLIFYEAFLSKEDSIRRERYFKTAKGKKTLRLIVRESINI